VINTNNDDDDDVIIIDDSDSGTEGGFKNSNSLMTRSAVTLQPSERITVKEETEVCIKHIYIYVCIKQYAYI
jgi:hypothetical protein